MNNIHPHMEYLEFGLSSYGEPQIEATMIRLPVRMLWVSLGFPDHKYATRYQECMLVFQNVTSSICEFNKYDERGDISHTYTEEHEFQTTYEGQAFLFEISGDSCHVSAWLEWKILAQDIRIESPCNVEPPDEVTFKTPSHTLPLDFSDCIFEEPIVNGSQLRVPVQNITVPKGFLGYSVDTLLKNAVLVFENDVLFTEIHKLFYGFQALRPKYHI